MNRIIINTPLVDGNKIKYSYVVEGAWKEAFSNEDFSIEYNILIEHVPEGVLLIPLIANVLPISWVYDAEIILPVCDRDFYESIRNFKQGYRDMYPGFPLNGTIKVNELQDNLPKAAFEKEDTAAFFSGGVDGFFTLIRHLDSAPTLITLWGSDVSLDDAEGWRKVKQHLEEVCSDYKIDNVTVKTGFRKFINGAVLDRKVRGSGDMWWHGFQHGIGIISHAAPMSYAMGKKTVFFASSFSAADKGNYTCASDPMIDNYIRFCGTNVVHDGYEYNRQEKINYITNYSRKHNVRIPLRVCWISKGGSNCCHCEKCWRTILGIYAAGGNPQGFGFEYCSFKALVKEIKNNRNVMAKYKRSRYFPIWKEMRKNYTWFSVYPGLRWFYASGFSELETGTKMYQKYRKLRRYLGRIKRRLLRK